MDRTRQIQLRQFKINRGVAAETALQHLGETFQEVREIILNDLIRNTKEAGEPDVYSVYLLTALTEMRTRLEEHIDAGQKAARARQKDIERNKDAGDSA